MAVAALAVLAMLAVAHGAVPVAAIAHLRVAETLEQGGQGRVDRLGRQHLAGVAVAGDPRGRRGGGADRHGGKERAAAERRRGHARDERLALRGGVGRVGVDAAVVGVAGADVDAAASGDRGGGVVDREAAGGAVDDLVFEVALVVAGGVEDVDDRPRALGAGGLEVVDDVDLAADPVDGDGGVAQGDEVPVQGVGAVDRRHRVGGVGRRVIDLDRVVGGVGDVEVAQGGGHRRGVGRGGNAREGGDRDAVAVFEAAEADLAGGGAGGVIDGDVGAGVDVDAAADGVDGDSGRALGAGKNRAGSEGRRGWEPDHVAVVVVDVKGSG